MNSSTTSIASIAALTSDSSASPVEISISSSAVIGSQVQLVWSVYSNAILMSVDTISIRIGTPVYLFEEAEHPDGGNCRHTDIMVAELK